MYTYIILFVCVLSTTYCAHERHAQHSERSVRHGHHSVRHNYRSRTAQSRSDQNCTEDCHSKEGVIFTKNKILAVYNATASTAFVLDSKASFSALLNGRSGNAVILKSDTNETAYLSGGSSGGTWKCSRQSIEDYLKNLTSLATLFKAGQSNNSDISKELADILGSLSSEYSCPSEALSTFLEISRISLNALKSFGREIGEVHANFNGDLKKAIGILQGLNEFFGQIHGEVNISLDLGKILNSPTGFQVLIYLLEPLASEGDVIQNLGTELNNDIKFLSLINQLSGNVTYGTGGFIHVISEGVALLHRNSSTESFVRILIAYYGDARTDAASASQQWKSGVQDLSNTIEKLNLSRSLPGLTKLLNDIRQDRWYINGVNVSALINAASQSNSRGGTYQIISVLSSIQQQSPPQQSIPILTQQLISLLNSSNGVRTLPILVPNFDISRFQTNSFTDILNIIPGGFQLFFESVQNFFKGMADFWTRIPIIGPIFAIIDEGIAAFFGGGATLAKLFRTDTGALYLNQILNFLRAINSGNGLPIPSPIGLIRPVIGNSTGNASGPINNGIGNFGQVASQVQNVFGNGPSVINPIPFIPNNKNSHKERKHSKDKERREHH